LVLESDRRIKTGENVPFTLLTRVEEQLWRRGRKIHDKSDRPASCISERVREKVGGGILPNTGRKKKGRVYFGSGIGIKPPGEAEKSSQSSAPKPINRMGRGSVQGKKGEGKWGARCRLKEKKGTAFGRGANYERAGRKRRERTVKRPEE